MDRVKTKTSGTDLSTWVFDTHKVFKWIQDFFEENVKKFSRKFFTTPGVFFYSTQNYLKCTSCVINGSNYDITIEAGSGITGDADMIILPSQIVNSDHANPGNNTTRYLYLHHITKDDTDTTYDVNRMPSSYSDINVHTMDSYEVKLEAAWPTGQELTDSIKIAKIDQDGSGAITITDERVQGELFNIPAAAWTWIFNNHTEIDKDGTSATEFYVDKGGVNAKVLTVPTAPQTPLNLHIYDINPDHSVPQSKVCFVTFKWGWEALTGAHNGGDPAYTIRITGVKSGDYQALNVAADELIGHKLYSPSFGSSDNTYTIIDNDATGTLGAGITLITLDSSYNNESVTENCNVICNADEMVMSVQPYVGGSDIPNQATLRILGYEYVANPTFTVRLPMYTDGAQAYYNVKIKAKRLDQESDYAVMGSGSYDPDHAGGGQGAVSYVAPFACKLPMLDDTGATLTLAPTTSGFQIDISPGNWVVSGKINQTAHYYEVIRTTLSSIDWNNYTNSIRFFTENLTIDVPTSFVRTWQVGMRPYQNGQVVGTPVEGQVTSGAMGVAPGDQAFLSQMIDVRTYSGTFSWNSGLSMWQITSDPKCPANHATNTVNLNALAAYLSSSEHQNILKDSTGAEFIISKNEFYLDPGTAIYFNLENLAGESVSPTAGTYEINTTERGRKVKVMNSLQVEYDAVYAYFDSDILLDTDVNNKGVIRVCQNSASGKTNADILNVWENDTGYEFELDFVIRNAYGNLGLLLDVWDPGVSSPNNTACIRGLFTLYMRPYIVHPPTGYTGRGSTQQ